MGVDCGVRLAKKLKQKPKECDLEEPSLQTRASKVAAAGPGPSTGAQGGEGELGWEDLWDEKPKEDTIHDILIWKYILLGMSFSAAPDNSNLLKSGVWERVVPII